MWHLHAFAAKFYQVWFKWQRRLPNTPNLKGSGQIKGQPLRSETCARHLPNPIGLSRAQNFTLNDTRQAQRCTSELHRHRHTRAHQLSPKRIQKKHKAITKPSRSPRISQSHKPSGCFSLRPLEYYLEYSYAELLRSGVPAFIFVIKV